VGGDRVTVSRESNSEVRQEVRANRINSKDTYVWYVYICISNIYLIYICMCVHTFTHSHMNIIQQYRLQCGLAWFLYSYVTVPLAVKLQGWILPLWGSQEWLERVCSTLLGERERGWSDYNLTPCGGTSLQWGNGFCSDSSQITSPLHCTGAGDFFEEMVTFCLRVSHGCLIFAFWKSKNTKKYCCQSRRCKHPHPKLNVYTQT